MKQQTLFLNLISHLTDNIGDNLDQQHERDGSKDYLDPTSTDRIHVDVIIRHDTDVAKVILQHEPKNNKRYVVNFIETHWTEPFGKLGLVYLEFLESSCSPDFEFISIKNGVPHAFRLQQLPMFITTDPSHSLPEGKDSNFRLHLVTQVKSMLDFVGCKPIIHNEVYQNGIFGITYTNNFTLLDTDRDPHETSIIDRISNDYKRFGKRMVKCHGELGFLAVSSLVDSFLRNSMQTHNFTATAVEKQNMMNNSLFDELLTDGWITETDRYTPVVNDFDDDEDEIICYSLTSKALEYRRNNTSRKHVREGLAVGDKVVDIYHGKYYEVMGMDMSTGEFNLMCSDTSAAKVNIMEESHFYKATQQDIWFFEQELKRSTRA